MLEKTNRRILSFALAFAMAGSCFGGALVNPADSQAAKKTKLKTKKVSLYVGKKKTIQITGKNSKAKYTFKASNKKIKVSKKGVITAVKKGTAKVTVKETLKKKTKKLGTVKVTVKTKAAVKPSMPAVTSPGTVTPPPANTSSSAPTASTAPTADPMTEPTNAPAERPTVEPAYELQTIDFDGSSSKVVESEITIPLEKAMQYGGLCKVTAEFLQDTGSAADISVGYEGEYLKFTKNGAYISKKWL